MKARLSIELDYDTSECEGMTPKEMAKMAEAKLEAAAHHLAGSGLLTGETPLIVETMNTTVTVISPSTTIIAIAGRRKGMI